MYVVLWEFQVRPGCADAFAAIYSPDGKWAALFARSAEFCGTELLSDGEHFFTIDRWASRNAYEQFRATCGTDYDALDAECEELTAGEKLVGAWETIAAAAPAGNFPGEAQYRVACEHDLNGREAEAVPHYERAFVLGLPPHLRRGASVGLGSTLRNVERHADAVNLLTAAHAEFPGDAAITAFLALALFSKGEPARGMSLLVDLAARHAPVGRYTRALREYATLLLPSDRR